MGVSASVKYVRLSGAMVAKPVSVRAGGAWHAVQSVPGAPTSVVASANVASAEVSWTAPLDTGGIPLTGYTVTSTPGGITANTTGTSTTVSGLTNGTAYTFSVEAANAVGSSASSGASNSVTPSAAITGKLYLTPASGTYSAGSTITLVIHADSLTTPVNAVQADLTYPSALMQFVSIDTTGSSFPQTLQSTGGSGTVHLSVGSLSTDPTGDNVIATVTFNYLGSGTASIGVAGTSAIYRSSDSADILNSTAGASYTLT
jgi:hypothetical protein